MRRKRVLNGVMRFGQIPRRLNARRKQNAGLSSGTWGEKTEC